MPRQSPKELADALNANGFRLSGVRGRRSFGEPIGEQPDVVTVYEPNPQAVMEYAARVVPAACAVVLDDGRVFLNERAPVARIVVQVVGEAMTTKQYLAVRDLTFAFGYEPPRPAQSAEPEPVKKSRKKKAAAPVEAEPVESVADVAEPVAE